MAEALNRGKWSQFGVPHGGWMCVDIEDLLRPDATCEMCEEREIRYVHHMTHPDYEVELKVGCVCAGHMEGNTAAAAEREQRLKSTAGRRSRWLTRRWNESAKGNPYLRTDGYTVTIFPSKFGGFSFSLKRELGPKPVFSPRSYPTEERAKLAAFEALTRATTHA